MPLFQVAEDFVVTEMMSMIAVVHFSSLLPVVGMSLVLVNGVNV